MNKVKEFFTTHKYAIFWTIGYIIIMWCILKGMFNFNMFSSAQWSYLMRAQLRGFGGFVFGILLLAAVPLYIATTMIIMRTHAPLFTLPRPKIFDKLFAKPAASAPTPDTPETTDTTPPPAEETVVFPENLPPELRAQFIRARQNIANNARINQNKPKEEIPAPTPAKESEPVSEPIHEPVPVGAPVTAFAPTFAPTTATPATVPGETFDSDDFPLPTDFDIDVGGDDFAGGTPFMSAPKFTEITFDEPAPATTPDDITTPGNENAVAEYLRKKSHKFQMDGDIVITDNMAIASHTDDDFWIADDETWFAAGKSRPSPVADAIRVAGLCNLRPVMYLGATNIMDLAERREKWTADGVMIINDLDALPLD